MSKNINSELEKLLKEMAGEFDRPQVPLSFDYNMEEVSFTNPKDNVLLSGTLTIPKGSVPFCRFKF